MPVAGKLLSRRKRFQTGQGYNKPPNSDGPVFAGVGSPINWALENLGCEILGFTWRFGPIALQHGVDVERVGS